MPGLLTRPVLRLEVSLGECRKETEAAVFGGCAAATRDIHKRKALPWFGCAGENGNDLPSQSRSSFVSKTEFQDPNDWHFDDTLTFAAQVSDLFGEGLKLRLGMRNEVCLGPLQVQLPRVHDLGEAVLCLRSNILKACTSSMMAGTPGGMQGAHKQVWQTPVIEVPLSTSAEKGQAVLALSFSVNVDPELLLREAFRAERSLVDRVVGPVVDCLDSPMCKGDAPQLCCTSKTPSSSSSVRQRCRQQCSSSSIWNRDLPSSDYSTCEVPPSLTSAYHYYAQEEDGLNGLNGLGLATIAASSGSRSRSSISSSTTSPVSARLLDSSATTPTKVIELGPAVKMTSAGWRPRKSGPGDLGGQDLRKEVQSQRRMPRDLRLAEGECLHTRGLR